MTIRDFCSARGAGGSKCLSMLACSGLLFTFFFLLIRPLEMENRHWAEQIAASPALSQKTREAEDRHASSLTEFVRVRDAVVGAFEQFYKPVSLRSIYGDLSALLSAKGLRIVTLDKQAASSEQTAAFFVRERSVWRLSGGFREYVSFKKALAVYGAAVVHIDEEKISRNKDKLLDIEVTLSVYRLGGA